MALRGVKMPYATPYILRTICAASVLSIRILLLPASRSASKASLDLPGSSLSAALPVAPRFHR
jgi:hypothetical protein